MTTKLTAESLLALTHEERAALPAVCVSVAPNSGCSDCWDCRDCWDCARCSYCSGCTDCQDCRGIVGGRGLRYVAWGVQLTAEQWAAL